MPPLIQRLTLERIGKPEEKQTFTFVDGIGARALGMTWESFDFNGIGQNFRNYEGGEPDYRQWTLLPEDRNAALAKGTRAATEEKAARLVHEQAELTNAWGDFAQQTGASMHELFPSVFSAES